MSLTSKGRIICDECGLFCRPVDDWTPFGCSQYEPYPEPHEPSHVCKRCWPKFLKGWKDRFKNGNRYGDWIKSRAEKHAAKQCGLVWIDQSAFPKGVEWKKQALYRYITRKEFNQGQLDENIKS